MHTAPQRAVFLVPGSSDYIFCIVSWSINIVQMFVSIFSDALVSTGGNDGGCFLGYVGWEWMGCFWANLAGMIRPGQMGMPPPQY
jgi:hypothetical protein